MNRRARLIIFEILFSIHIPFFITRSDNGWVMRKKWKWANVRVIMKWRSWFQFSYTGRYALCECENRNIRIRTHFTARCYTIRALSRCIVHLFSFGRMCHSLSLSHTYEYLMHAEDPSRTHSDTLNRIESDARFAHACLYFCSNTRQSAI